MPSLLNHRAHGAQRRIQMSETILISKRDAAKALSISLRTLDNLISAKEITVRRVGRRCLIPRKALEEFARRDHSTHPDRNAARPEIREASNANTNS
jgi:excisionase family DNA binding protein